MKLEEIKAIIEKIMMENNDTKHECELPYVEKDIDDEKFIESIINDHKKLESYIENKDLDVIIPWIIAIKRNDEKLIEVLVSFAAPINHIINYGIKCHEIKIVEFMIKRFQNELQMRDLKNEDDIVTFVINNNMFSSLKILIRCDFKIPDKFDFIHVVKSKFNDMLKYIISRKLIDDGTNKIIYRLAVQYNNMEMVEYLDLEDETTISAINSQEMFDFFMKKKGITNYLKRIEYAINCGGYPPLVFSLDDNTVNSLKEEDKISISKQFQSETFVSCIEYIKDDNKIAKLLKLLINSGMGFKFSDLKCLYYKGMIETSRVMRKHFLDYYIDLSARSDTKININAVKLYTMKFMIEDNNINTELKKAIESFIFS